MDRSPPDFVAYIAVGDYGTDQYHTGCGDRSVCAHATGPLSRGRVTTPIHCRPVLHPPRQTSNDGRFDVRLDRRFYGLDEQEWTFATDDEEQADWAGYALAVGSLCRLGRSTGRRRSDYEDAKTGSAGMAAGRVFCLGGGCQQAPPRRRAPCITAGVVRFGLPAWRRASCPRVRLRPGDGRSAYLRIEDQSREGGASFGSVAGCVGQTAARAGIADRPASIAESSAEALQVAQETSRARPGQACRFSGGSADQVFDGLRRARASRRVSTCRSHDRSVAILSRSASLPAGGHFYRGPAAGLFLIASRPTEQRIVQGTELLCADDSRTAFLPGIGSPAEHDAAPGIFRSMTWA